MKTRNEFLSEIEVILKDHQFEKIDDSFVCIQQHEQQGLTININGQVIQQPPQTIVNKFVIKCLGEGWVADSDGETNKIPFEQIRYEVFQNDNLMSILEECFYYDEADRVMNNFIKP